MENSESPKTQIEEHLQKFLENYDNTTILEAKIKTLLSINLRLANKDILNNPIIDNNVNNFGINKNEYHCTDIHGDIFLLINHVIESGLAKLDSDNPYLFYKIENGNKIEIPFESSVLNNDTVIAVPNFILNEDFTTNNKKFIFHGDLLNRGNQSVGCFITMLDLLEKLNNNSLKWVYGNHDVDFILTETIYKDCGKYSDDELEFIQTNLKKLSQGENLVFCYHTPESNFLSSHTILEKKQILKFFSVLDVLNPNKIVLNYLFDNKDSNENYEKYKNLRLKINENSVLELNDIKNLSVIFNKAFSKVMLKEENLREKSKELEQSIYNLTNFCFVPNLVSEGLLCLKVNCKTNSTSLEGIRNIIGHNDDLTTRVFNNGQILCLDARGSVGLNARKIEDEYIKDTIFSNLLFVRNGIYFTKRLTEQELVANFRENCNSKSKNNYFQNKVKENRKNDCFNICGLFN